MLNHSVQAQQSSSRDSIQTLVSSYSFIQQDSNRIIGDSNSLTNFYEKLWELSQGKRKTVTIVHIGDSHIQADFLSAIVRKNLQEQFGNAGRGTVFPYRVAHSNEPWSYKTSGTGNWIYARNVKPIEGLHFGLAGHTIAAGDTNSTFQIRVDDALDLNYGFNRVSLFHSKGQRNLNFMLCDEFNCFLAKNDPTDTTPYISVFTFDTLYHSLVIDCIPGDSAANRLEIYGMLLENGQSGLLYNMIGVNGATYADYNNSDLFFTQLALLKPDLVMVSLGTNEGYARDFNANAYRQSIEQFMQNLRGLVPESDFLLTSPGDSFKRYRRTYVRNPNMQIARNTLLQWCDSNQVACWDLFGIMGGYGSMTKWYAAGLAARDRLHYSKKGYEIQGHLLSEALLAGYSNYIRQKQKGQ